MMKKLFLFFNLFIFTFAVSAQFQERIVQRGGKVNEEITLNGLSTLGLRNLNPNISWPSELKGLTDISLYDIPFEVDSTVKFGIGMEETGQLSISVPKATKEVFILMYADFPTVEKIGIESVLMPLDVLDQPERILFELKYDDGSVDQLIPVNAEKQIYGITRGRGLYSLKAPNGKSIAELTFHDKMTNASFLFAGVSLNSKQYVIADPPVQSVWYPAVKKVESANVEFIFEKKAGLAWGKIRSAMLPEEIDLSESPVFRMVIDGDEIPSTAWKVVSEQNIANKTTYLLSYQKGSINLEARLITEKTLQSEILLTLNVINKNKKKITGTLYFPVVEGIAIENVDETWYSYARDGLVLNKIPCSWRDNLGSEKPIQYDGIFNPSKGVGIAFLPRDTIDVFRWYNFSKNEAGINYSLEFAPQEVQQGESFKSIAWAMAVVPGDWKDQFKVYQDWLGTWYKPLVPRLPWFQKVFAFVIDNASEYTGVKDPDVVAHAKAYKERWGALDYYHIWGWSYSGTMGGGSWWGDYSNFENLGGKEKLKKTVKYFQEEMKVPFALYVDAYLMSLNAKNVADSLKFKWAIKNSSGEPIKPYSSYAMCLYDKDWRNYLKNVYVRLENDLGLKGIYFDEAGMYMRSRVCFDKNHGHPVPYYQASSEIAMMKELKTALPKVAIYAELGATDVFSQYSDGSFGYTTFWGGVPPRSWGNYDAHPSYNVVAPHYLHLRRFATPGYKTIELNMFETPWRNGNWYILKFPFFNGNGYYNRFNDGVDADQEAIDQYKKIRLLQEKYKNEFSSIDVEPMLRTEMSDIFVNRFSTPQNDVYTVYNAGFRTKRGQMIILDKTGGSSITDEWTNKKVNTVELADDKVGIWLEIGPRSVFCFVRKKAR